MLGLGLHFAWNVMQGCLYSNENLKLNSLINLEVNESIFAGGKVNPESGIIVSIVFIMIVIYLLASNSKKIRKQIS